MLKNLAATIIAAILITGISIEMNRMHPVQHGIAPKKLLVSSRYRAKPLGKRVTRTWSAIPVPVMKASLKRCDFLVLLGCFHRRSAASRQLVSLRSSLEGGRNGLVVIKTQNIPAFIKGYYCVADGPYASRRHAQRIAWNTTVHNAYIRKSCEAS